MYIDQHSIESLGTIRLLTRAAPDLEYYLLQMLGRTFVMAQPIEVLAPVRLRVKFVSDKQGSGERSGPFIESIVEFNPAMGLYTVTGKYWSYDGAPEPMFVSSPRSGFDDEMLADPSRFFDWLIAMARGRSGSSVASISMESVAEALASLTTPAGEIEEVLMDDTDGAIAIRLAPEYRMPLDYYVSGTHFGGPRNDFAMMSKSLTVDDWQMNYEQPVKNAVLKTLDNLYGYAMFNVEVDEEGFVYVNNLTFPLKQESKTSRKRKSALAESVLRMAGVDGRERYSDRRLTESRTVRPQGRRKQESLQDAMRSLLAEAEAKVTCEECGAEIVVEEAKEQRNGRLLCEKCYGAMERGEASEKYAKLVTSLKKKGADDPKALAAWIGREKLGKAEFQRRAKAGRK